jgi:hypothetical protein
VSDETASGRQFNVGNVVQACNARIEKKGLWTVYLLVFDPVEKKFYATIGRRPAGQPDKEYQRLAELRIYAEKRMAELKKVAT